MSKEPVVITVDLDSDQSIRDQLDTPENREAIAGVVRDAMGEPPPADGFWADAPVPATVHVDASMDGRVVPWEGRVWCNPPYGRTGVDFMRRMTEHRDGLLLGAARTETKAFQNAARRADAVCFLRERLHFIRPDGFQGRAGFGSALLAFGSDCVAALGGADLGWTLRGRP